MVKLYSVGALTADTYVGGKANADVVNGSFGTLVGGVFTNALGDFMVDTIVKGDDMYIDGTPIKAGTELKLVDMKKVVGKKVQVSPKSMSGTPVVGKFLQADAKGVLKVVASAPSTGVYLVIDELIEFDGKGVLATIATA